MNDQAFSGLTGPKPIAIITGAGGGMGRACARRLAQTHALVLTDFSQARLDAIADQLRDEDDAEIAGTICGDITDDGTIAGIVGAAPKGSCKVLIHTAGLSPGIAPWKPIVTTNLIGTAKLLSAVEPLLSTGFVGVILSSTARCFVPPASPELTTVLADPLNAKLLEQLEPLLGDDDATRAANAYGYTKAWTTEKVQRLASPWAARGGRIVSLSPGFILTGMTRAELVARPEMGELRNATPAGRWGTVNDIANLIEFVVSDRATFITGTDIIIDGGLSAGRLGAEQ